MTNPASQHYYGYVQTNPVNWTYPSGKFLPLVAMGIGAAVRGIAGAGTYALWAWSSGQTIRGDEAAIAFGAGATAGAMATVAAMAATTGLGAGALASCVGAAANTAQYAATQSVNQEALSPLGVGIAAASGGAAGLFAGPLTRQAVEAISVPLSECASYGFIDASGDYIESQLRSGIAGGVGAAVTANQSLVSGHELIQPEVVW